MMEQTYGEKVEFLIVKNLFNDSVQFDSSIIANILNVNKKEEDKVSIDVIEKVPEFLTSFQILCEKNAVYSFAPLNILLWNWSDLAAEDCEINTYLVPVLNTTMYTSFRCGTHLLDIRKQIKRFDEEKIEINDVRISADFLGSKGYLGKDKDYYKLNYDGFTCFTASDMILRLFFALCLVPSSLSITISQELLDNLYREKLNAFKVKLQHTLEGAEIRRKREIGNSNDFSSFTVKDLGTDSTISEDKSYLKELNLTTWTSFNYMESYYVFIATPLLLSVLNVTESVESPEVVAYISFTENESFIKAKAFSYSKELWFVVQKSSNTGSKIQLYQRNDLSLEQRQFINFGHFDFDIIEIRGILYLVVVNYESEGSPNQGMVMLYEWMQTQFDLVASKAIEGAQSVTCWSIDGTLFIAVAQSTHENFSLQSSVFIFNKKDGGNLILQNRLPSSRPRKLVHFFVRGSHYLIFIGASSAEIYWWFNGEFLVWQHIHGTANASDVSVIALPNGEVVLVIVLNEEALFFTLDSTGNYEKSFTMKFTFTIKSLQFIYGYKNYYALALPAETTKFSKSVWKLSFANYELSGVRPIDPLVKCLHDIANKTAKRQEELDALEKNISRVWLTNKEQIVTADVRNEGYITTSETVVIDEIFIVSNEINVVMPADINSTLLGLYDAGFQYVQQVPNIVRKAEPQIITGNTIFTDLINIQTLSMSSKQELSINGISTNKLFLDTLKKNGEQILNGDMYVGEVIGQTLNTGTLNGIDLHDLILLNGQQNVLGSLSFYDVHGTNLAVDFINGVQITNLVSKTSNELITEMKAVGVINASSINVEETTNGIYLKEKYDKIFTLDSYQEPSGEYKFDNLHINGDLFIIDDINDNVNLQRLDVYAVKKDKSQNITGQKNFTSFSVLNDVNAYGLVNGIDLKKLFTLSGDQTVSSNISGTVFSFNDSIEVNTLNGLNLNKDLVKKDSEAEILGMKMFNQTIYARNITVWDSKTINDIDISESARALVIQDDGFIRSENSVFPNVVVRGNLTLHDQVNGYHISDLPKVVWLKSKIQEIHNPVSVPSLALQSTKLNVDELNDINIDSGFVHVNDQQAIEAGKIFIKIHVVNNVSIADGTYVENVDLSSFNEESVNLGNSDKIYGEKTFEMLEIKELHTMTINSLNVNEDFLFINDIQQMGTKEYKSLIVLDDLNTQELNAATINNKDIKKLFNDAVLKDSNSKLIKKTFAHLKVMGISIADGGQIAGVTIDDMLTRAVTLDTRQKIYAAKSYESIFLKSASVNIVNGENFDQFISKTILANKTALPNKVVIEGKKTFIGSVSAANLTAKNGIYIVEMQENRISKTKPNTINSIMFFGSNLHIRELEVLSSSYVDGLLMSSLVYTHNGLLELPVWDFSNLKVNGDIFVNGMTNGCDLTTVNSHALRIREAKNQTLPLSLFDNLNIKGDVYFKNSLNGLSLEKLKESLIGDSRYHHLSGSFHIHPGIATDSINVIGTINGLNLTFFLEDAMKSTTPQVVKGFKRFTKDLAIEFLTGESNLNVRTSLNGIEIHELLGKAIYKDKVQTLEGDKIYADFKAKNMVVLGSLNSVKFPEDIVRTSVSEYISSPVFMEDLHIWMNLEVNGKINDISLKQTVENVLTLDKDETVLSNLNFDDVVVQDNFDVTQGINGLPLEIIVKTRSDSQMDDFKGFFNNVIIWGNLSVSSINRQNIQDLYHSLVKKNENEILKDKQVFAGSIYSEDETKVSLINNISITSIANLFLKKSHGLELSLGFYRNISISNEKDLDQKLDLLPYEVSSLAYFITIQELHFEASKRVLGGFKQKSENGIINENFVIWTTKTDCDQKSCCGTDSHWYSANEDGIMSSNSDVKQGQYFPLPLPLVKAEDLTIWINKTFGYPCSKFAYEETVIGWLGENYSLKFSKILSNSKSLVDVRVFKDGLTYVVAAFNYYNLNGEYGITNVYINDFEKGWLEYQELRTYGVLSMDLIVFQRKETLLALGTGNGTYPESYSTVYRWDEAVKVFHFMQNIPSQYVRNILWFTKGPQLLLAVAGTETFENSDQCYGVTEGGQIDIYLYQSKLTLIQTLQLPGVISTISFEIKGETYLVAASEVLHSTVLYQWQGFKKFVLLQTMESFDVTHLNYFWRSDDLYLTIASNSRPLKILKAIIRGNRFKTTYYNEEMPELNDEPVSKSRTCLSFV